jgi:hypothetical protein
MPYTTEKKSESHPLTSIRAVAALPNNRQDGTSQLLIAGAWTLAAGVVAAILTATVFGGISRHGPHTNSGWLALMAAMACMPFGSMLFALGSAKWLRNRRLRKTAGYPR